MYSFVLLLESWLIFSNRLHNRSKYVIYYFTDCNDWITLQETRILIGSVKEAVFGLVVSFVYIYIYIIYIYIHVYIYIYIYIFIYIFIFIYMYIYVYVCNVIHGLHTPG